MSEIITVVDVAVKEDSQHDADWDERATQTIAELFESVEDWHTATRRTGELLETVRVNGYYRAAGYVSFGDFIRGYGWDPQVCDQIERRYRALCAPSRPVAARPRRQIQDGAGGVPVSTEAPVADGCDSRTAPVEVSDAGSPPLPEAPRGEEPAVQCVVDDGPGSDDRSGAGSVVEVIADTATDGVPQPATDEPGIPIEPGVTSSACRPDPIQASSFAVGLWSREELAVVIDAATKHADLGDVVQSHHCLRLLEVLDRDELADFWRSALRRDELWAAVNTTDLARRLIARVTGEGLQAVADALNERASDLADLGEYEG